MDAKEKRTAEATLAIVTQLLATVEELKDIVVNTPRLHRKDVMLRYGISPSTLHRRLRAGTFPSPVRFCGPLWRLKDLEAAEKAGRIQRQISA